MIQFCFLIFMIEKSSHDFLFSTAQLCLERKLPMKLALQGKFKFLEAKRLSFVMLGLVWLF